MHMISQRSRLGWLLIVASAILFFPLAGCSSQKDKTPVVQITPGVAGQGKKADDPHAGHDMGAPGGMLMTMTEPHEVQAGQPAKLQLMIHGTGGMVKDFDIIHTKKVHLIIVRKGLDQFAHIHPEVAADGNMTASFTFPVGGTYQLYADYKETGKEEATAMSEVTVKGEAPPAAELMPSGPGKATGDGLNAQVSFEEPKVGGMTNITFKVEDPTGKQVDDLQPYLGAMGHLVIISADGKQYVHAHPMESKAPEGKVEFGAHFMAPGIYKAWGQFQRQDHVYTIPFVLKVS